MAVQINVQANQAALAASIAAGVANFNNSLARNNQLNLQVNARGFSQPLGRITGDVKDFEAALAASNARVIAFGASTAVLGGVIRSFKELASVTIDVEKNLIDINRVFGLTTSQLQKFSTDLFQVSKQTATSFNDASKAALEFSRQGLAAEETLQRTKDALTLARVAGISYANAVDALTSTVNGFEKSGITTTQVLNKLVAVEQDFAVGAGDLAEALARTGQAAQEAGVSLDQLNALVTVAQERTARGGAVIGNALKTIFTRLQRTDTLDQLEQFNIAVRDVQGNILPAVTILQNFANSYNNLADAQRAQLSEQVAGVYQVNILKAIVGDLNSAQGVYARSLQKGASATNEAEIATAKLNQSLDALLSQTGTSAQQLANNIGKITFAPLAKEAVSVGNLIFESLNNVLEGEGIGNTFAVGFLKGIRNLIAGPGAIAAFFTLFKLLQNSFSYLTQALPQIAGITTETQNRQNIENSILQILKGQGTASQALVGLMGNEVAQAQLLLQIARQQTAEYQTQQRLAKSLAGSLSAQGVVVRGGSGLQVTRSSGYIPTSTKLAEKIGAVAGGYVPGNVVKAPSSVGGVMNSAEKVKYVPGFAQPFINPPANSRAGRSHRKNSIKKTGVDPYMYDGFIPNFVGGVDLGARGKQFEKLLNKKLTGEESHAGSALLDFPYPSNQITKASKKAKNEVHLNSETVFGDAKITSAPYSRKDLIKKLVGSLDKKDYEELIDRVNYTKTNFINLNNFLPVKPSLISNKSTVTADDINAKSSAELGKDVISNLARLKNNVITKTLSEEGYRKRLLLNYIEDYVTIKDFSNSGFIPNFAIGQFKEWMRSKGKAAELANYNLSDVNWYRNNPALVNSLQSNLSAYKAETGDNYSPAILDVFKKSVSSAQSAAPSVLKQISEVPEIPSVGPTLNAASVVARMQNQKSFAAGYPELQAIINNPTKTQKEKDDAQNIIKQNFGKAYEKFAINKLKEIGYTSVISAESLGLFGAKSGQTSVDAVDLATKTFFEFKGGEVENRNINDKFRRVRTDPGNFDVLTDNAWKNVLVSNEYNEGAKSGNKVIYLNPAEQASEMLYLKEGLGTATKSFGPTKLSEGIIPTIEKEARRTAGFFGRQNSGGFIPNFAKFKSKYGTATLGKTDPIDLEFFSKTIGRKIKSSDIVSIEDLTTKGKGNAAGLYGDIATNIKGKEGVFGYALAQNRAVDPSKAKNPLAKLNAKYPQITKRIGLGGETFISGDYGQTVIRANSIQDLIKYQDQILKMVDPAVLTLKSFSNGFIPNFAIPTVRKGYAFSDGRIFDSFDHSDAWDDIVGPKKGAKKYEYRPDLGTLLIQGEVSEQLRKAFAERHVTSINKVVSLEERMKEKNAQDTINMIKRLGLISLGGGYKAVFEKGLYQRVIKDNKYFDILGGIEPEYIKMLGGIEGFIEREKKKGWLKWEDLPSDFSTGSSNGFIPSFAYKNSVMQLEESLSGEKAILDTKTGPFPFIRNSSQPNFAAAIADHGGLNNALSDSYRNQKTAGLMNKGFVPNFAKSEKDFREAAFRSLAKELGVTVDQLKRVSSAYKQELASRQEEIKKRYESITAQKALAVSINQNKNAQQKAAQQTTQQTAQQKTQQSKFAKALEKGSTTLAIAGPMLAGFIEQAAFGNKERTDLTATERGVKSALSTGLTSVTTGASIGAAFGPLGAGVGAAAGALFGFSQALMDAKLTAEELAQVDQKNIEIMQKNAAAGSDYLSKQKELSDLISSGASQSKIDMAAKAVSSSFLEIKDVKLAEALSKTKGSINDMSNVLDNFNKQVQKRQSITSALSAVQGGSIFSSAAQKGVKDAQKVAADLYTFFNEQQYGLGTLKTSLMSFEEFRQMDRSVGGESVRKVYNEMIERSINDLIEMAMPEIKKGSPEYIQQFQRFSDLLTGKSSQEILKEIIKFENLSADQQKRLTKEIAVEANLYKTRINIQEQILKDIEIVNQQIMRDEFGQKILDATATFQESLMSSFVDPLTQISVKQQTAVARQAGENRREVQKINLDFYEKTFSDLSKKINDEKFIKEQLSPAFERFKQTGDINEIRTLTLAKEINDPETIRLFKESIMKYDSAINRQAINNQGQLDILAKQFEIERIKENNNKIMNSILQKEILSLGKSERFELARRTNVELSIDAIERRMSDEARYFGRGVLGKAEKKSAYRTEISRKKIIEDEIQKSMSAQGGYSEIINIQRQALLDQATVEDASLPGLGMLSRKEAENISSIQIKNAQDLAQAIQQTESITFTNAEQERKRLSTIESLKKIQEEINQGKIKEEEITARINEEETERARRSTSFSYNLREGFDSVNTESELIVARLGKDLPRMFADNMTGALMDIAKGTENIGDAFMKVATNFGSTILEAIIKANMYKLIGSVGAGLPITSQKGGYIRAQNGMYINGTGSGDRYPALLENGEYVLNRNAVMAMGGPASLDKLNFSMAPRFASGGAYSSPEYTTLSDLENNLTPQGLEQSKLYQDLYSAEKTKQEEAIRKAYERKVRRAQMIGQIAGAVVAIGASAGMNSLPSKSSSISKGSAQIKPSNLGYGMGSSLTSSYSSTIGSQTGGYIGNRLSDTIPAYMSGGLISQPIFNKHTPGMQYGGPSSNASSNSLTTNNNNTSNNNSFNFAVNVNRDNKVEIGADSSSYEQKDVEFSKKMNSQVYTTVLNVIKNEKRFGGSLSNTKTRV